MGCTLFSNYHFQTGVSIIGFAEHFGLNLHAQKIFNFAPVWFVLVLFENLFDKHLPEPEIVSPFSGSLTGTASLIRSLADVPVSPWAAIVAAALIPPCRTPAAPGKKRSRSACSA